MDYLLVYLAYIYGLCCLFSRSGGDDLFRLWQENQKEYVTVSLIGDSLFKGIIFDSGSDIIVLFNGKEFIYIPVNHIEYIAPDIPDTELTEPSNFQNILSNNSHKDLTFDSILKEAIGVYQQLCIINKKQLHGTIIEVLEDYIVFSSPIYQKIYIAKKHLKWLIPYTVNERPYGLSEDECNWQQVEKGSREYFTEQLRTLSNKLVVINLGEKYHHIGKLKNISNEMLELKSVKDNSMYVNIAHIQTIHEV